MAGPSYIPAQSRTATANVLKWLRFDDYELLSHRLREENEYIRKTLLTKGGEEATLLLEANVNDQSLYFSLLYLSYNGLADHGLPIAKAFLERQHPDGFIPGTASAKGEKRLVAPFLAQIILLGSKQRNHFTWLQEAPEAGGPSYYDRLKAYLKYWKSQQDTDGNGLPASKEILLPATSNEPSEPLERVAVACLLHREFKAMAQLAHQLHHPEDIDTFEARAKALAENLNAHCWDEQSGFYYDRNETTGTFSPIPSATGFLPLFAGVAPYDRAERLVSQHLNQEDIFGTTFPVPAQVPIGEEAMVWIPLNYMIFQGLMDYGYREEAKAIAEKTFNMVFQAKAPSPGIYDTVTGKQQKAAPAGAWAAIGLLLPWEYELNYTPSTLSWQPLIRLVPDYLTVKFESIDRP